MVSRLGLGKCVRSAWYLKGVRGAELRNRIMRAKTQTEIVQILQPLR